MSNSIRVLGLETADGAANMAADEVLLEAAGRGLAAIRFYTWSEPTLSLGYFQPAAEREAEPLLKGLPWVRRSTGGSALVHHFELTYTLALPSNAPWQKRGESWICRMHGIIARALATFGIPGEGLTCAAETRLGPVLCFQHHTPGDLVLKGHKVTGSAQRKQRGALMQHGGILLAQSPFAPSLPGVRELAGIDVSAGELADAICREFARETGWAVEAGEWTAPERSRVRELAETKYLSDAWNLKR